MVGRQPTCLCGVCPLCKRRAVNQRYVARRRLRRPRPVTAPSLWIDSWIFGCGSNRRVGIDDCAGPGVKMDERGWPVGLPPEGGD